METIRTHISLSGKRVPCGATKRPCPRKGHQIIAAPSDPIRRSQRNSVEPKTLFEREKQELRSALSSRIAATGDLPPAELSDYDKAYLRKEGKYIASLSAREAFIAEIRQAHAAERAAKNEAAGREAKGSDWDKMTSEEQRLFTQQRTKEENDAFRRSAFAQVTDPFDLARMVNQAPSNDSALFETLASNAAVRPETLAKILKRNAGNKKVYDLLLSNPNTPERTRTAILNAYSQAR